MQSKILFRRGNLTAKIKSVALPTMVATYVLRAINTILNWKDLPCFGHNLHLAIGNALKDDRRVECTVAVCKKLVSSFSYSYKKKNEI